MSEKRFQKTRIVDKWGGIYDSQTDRILDVNDVEHKLNDQQATIKKLEEENRELRQTQDVKEFSALFNQSIALQREIRDLKEENEKLKCINDQLEERLENSGIGVALKMDCDNV